MPGSTNVAGCATVAMLNALLAVEFCLKRHAEDKQWIHTNRLELMRVHVDTQMKLLTHRAHVQKNKRKRDDEQDQKQPVAVESPEGPA